MHSFLMLLYLIISCGYQGDVLNCKQEENHSLETGNRRGCAVSLNAVRALKMQNFFLCNALNNLCQY